GDRVESLLGAAVLAAACLADPALLLADLRAVGLLVDHHVVELRPEFFLGERRAIGLHRQAVPRGRPDLIELGVAVVTGLGTDELLIARWRRGRRRSRRRGWALENR